MINAGTRSTTLDYSSLSTITSFYRYASEEGVIENSPAVHIRRPRLDYESHAVGLDRNELGAFLVAAGLSSPRDHALCSPPPLNGLWISEALNAEIEQLGLERGHRTLVVHRKGGKTVTIPLAPRTARALDLAIGERVEGPLFLGANGDKLTRDAAARMVRRVTKAAGITKRIGPHSLRHSFITAALDAGVPLRDVQEAASHADPRTTMRYDRARQSLDRHATYIVATFVAGSSRGATTRHRSHHGIRSVLTGALRNPNSGRPPHLLPVARPAEEPAVVASPTESSGTPRASPRLEVEHPPTDVVPSPLVPDDQFTDRIGNPRGQPHA